MKIPPSIQSLLFLCTIAASAYARTAFEKLTDFDFTGTTYYTVKNLSLYECQGWCREEPDCQAAAFSFVVNPLTPAQETVCQLQNDSSAHNPSAVAQRATSMYYMVKLQVWKHNWRPNFKFLFHTTHAHIFISASQRKCLPAAMVLRTRSEQNNSRPWQCTDLHEHQRGMPVSVSQWETIHLPIGWVRLQ